MPCFQYLWSLRNIENFQAAGVIVCLLIVLGSIMKSPTIRAWRAKRLVQKAYAQLHRRRAQPSERLHDILNTIEDYVNDVRQHGERLEALAREEEVADERKPA